MKKEQDSFIQKKHEENGRFEKSKFDQVQKVEEAKRQHAIAMKFFAKMEQQGKNARILQSAWGANGSTLQANAKRSISQE